MSDKNCLTEYFDTTLSCIIRASYIQNSRFVEKIIALSSLTRSVDHLHIRLRPIGAEDVELAQPVALSLPASYWLRFQRDRNSPTFLQNIIFPQIFVALIKFLVFKNIENWPTTDQEVKELWNLKNTKKNTFFLAYQSSNILYFWKIWFDVWVQWNYIIQ